MARGELVAEFGDRMVSVFRIKIWCVPATRRASKLLGSILFHFAGVMKHEKP